MIKQLKWTKKDEMFLIKNINSKKYREIASVLNRTISSVIGKAQSLNIQANVEDISWSKEEISFWRENGKRISVKEIASALQRSASATRTKMFFLGIPTIYKSTPKKGSVRNMISLKKEDQDIIERKYGTFKNMVLSQIELLKNE